MGAKQKAFGVVQKCAEMVRCVEMVIRNTERSGSESFRIQSQEDRELFRLTLTIMLITQTSGVRVSYGGGCHDVYK